MFCGSQLIEICKQIYCNAFGVLENEKHFLKVSKLYLVANSKMKKQKFRKHPEVTK